MHTVNFPRTCLGFTNFIFFTTGFAGLVICVWCSHNSALFRDVNYSLTKSSQVDTIVNFFKLKFFLTSVTSILVLLALFTIATSCCGIIGAGCKLKCALKTYIFLTTSACFFFCWIFLITGLYNIYTNNANTRESLKLTLKNYYGKDDDLITKVFDYVMIEHECCGVDSYADFYSSPWREKHPNLTYPKPCCKLNKTSLMPISKNCTLVHNSNTTSHIYVGCFDVLRNAINRNKPKIVFYVILIGIAYLLITTFAACIISGQPLLGPATGSSVWAKGPLASTEEGDTQAPLPSAPIESTMYIGEQPQKVVRVVSTTNPFQSYVITPNPNACRPLRDNMFAPNYGSY